MGIYSTFVRSWKKSFRLRRLQLKIASPDQTVDDGNPEEDKALEYFLDLCEEDDGIRKLMEIEPLSRSDLKEFYHRLCRAGARAMGQRSLWSVIDDCVRRAFAFPCPSGKGGNESPGDLSDSVEVLVE